MIPQDKCDEKSIELLRSAADREVLENADQLLVWLQDVNWPVFDGVVKRLALLGDALVNPVNAVLEGDDSMWKANIVGYLIPSFSRSAQTLYTTSLESLLARGNEQDMSEGVIDFIEIHLRVIKSRAQ